MRNDFCTGYLAHSAKGKTWQNHKYVAKVKLANGSYFYFYNEQQYQNYLKNRAKADAAAKSGGGAAAGAKGSTSKEDRKTADIERVKNAKDTSSKSKKGKTSSSSKKTSSKSGKTSGKIKSTKEKTKKEKAIKQPKEKSTKEKAKKVTKNTVQQTTEEVKKVTPSLSSYKYQYDLKDEDIDIYKGNDSERITADKVQEILQDAIDKYPDNSSGYLLSGFQDNITYNFKWVKENGTIKLLDPDTGEEIASNVALLNCNNASLFRTDDKKKKS